MNFKTYEDRCAVRAEIESVIKNFQDAAKSHFGDHAYSTGYLGSMLTSYMLDHADKKDIDTSLHILMEATIQMQKQALMSLVKAA